MLYTLELSQGLEVPGGSPEHFAESGRVGVSLTTDLRWAEVTCSCGSAAVARWTASTTSYADLVSVAWSSGCGAIALRAV